MTKRQGNDAKDRLKACGISVSKMMGRSWPGAMNKRGHLSIQIRGCEEIKLGKVLPILQDLSETFELAFLGRIAANDLRHLAGLKNILSLKLSGGEVTDAGLEHISGLTSLRVLDLREMPLAAPGMRHLGGLEHLCDLQL
jgi:hypothetical protein